LGGAQEAAKAANGSDLIAEYKPTLLGPTLEYFDPEQKLSLDDSFTLFGQEMDTCFQATAATADGGDGGGGSGCSSSSSKGTTCFENLPKRVLLWNLFSALPALSVMVVLGRWGLANGE